MGFAGPIHAIESGIEPSGGGRGDSYDNALAETINGLYKAELIHRRGNRGLTSMLGSFPAPWHSEYANKFF